MSTLTVPVVYGPYSNPDATDTDDTGAGSPVIETTLTASSETRQHRQGSTCERRGLQRRDPRARLSSSMSAIAWSCGWSTCSLIQWAFIGMASSWRTTQTERRLRRTRPSRAPAQVLGNGVPAGGTFLYKFKVPRAGLFWYHPHHHNSINRVYRGLYGMIIVTDPLEAGLVGSVLPAAADTMQLVLSDITVCKAWLDRTRTTSGITSTPRR